jgi:uncharacterized ferritin-like protein (DUF455 family)
MRAPHTKEGICDRLRAVAFAELQAHKAFDWAAGYFEDAPKALRIEWKGLALAETRHYTWLMNRLEELGGKPDERPVSNSLWYSIRTCTNARQFAFAVATAEHRGRLAGEKLFKKIKTHDAVSAEIFRKIAEEEVSHVELPLRHYPEFLSHFQT